MRILLLLVLVIMVLPANAQQYDKYIIQFTDKNNSPYTLSAPAEYLSVKAIERRTRYNIPPDSSDLPVNPQYIQAVLAKGNCRLLAQSKWLNDILIYTSDPSIIDSINTLPFVKKSQATGFLTTRINIPVTNKFYYESAHTQMPGTSYGNTGDTLQYASTYAQIHLHNGQFLHNKGYQGQGITIAMLDAGFYHYTTLTAFDSIRLNNQVLGVRDFVDFDNSVTEDDAHGMECLSTIAANIPGTMIGTAPKASFWLLRSENALSEYPIEEHNWVTAAEFADSAGADMITSSLGYYVFDDASFNHTYADFYRNTTMVSKGAAYAVKKGMIVTNSAGNEGSNGWKYIIFPADADSVCTVGATDTAGNIADFSSYGYPGKIKPDIVSAGYATTVFGTGGTPVIGYGTSFSNPNINGLIACLWQAFPQYNNMTILDAVYKSSSKYQTPDDRYGYGIPNMRKAYLILKQKQNNSLYGSNWLFAAPNPFTDTIHVTLIGQVDGPAVLTLKNSAGIIITSVKLTTEEGEVYEATFKNLAGQPGGNYTLAYTDSLTTASLPLYKNGATVNWLLAYPSPFSNLLTVYLNAPETGTAFIRLIDVNGKILASKQVSIVQNNSYSIQFANTAALAKGIYFIQYRGVVKRTIKVIK